MATYTVLGHPLNYADIGQGLTQADSDSLRAALMTLGVGQTFTLTLAAPADTKAKDHKLLK